MIKTQCAPHTSSRRICRYRQKASSRGHIKPLARSESFGLEHICQNQADNGPFLESGFLASGKHAKRAPSLRPLIGAESVQQCFTGETG